jgi:CheY-like chemotaxis protein
LQATPVNILSDSDATVSAAVRTILYVEDNLDSLKLMQGIVGHIPNTRLLIAHNAKLGIALANQKKPDLILLDINLPGLSGIEALGILRHMNTTQHIPVIALTGKVEPADIERGLAAGFDDYMTKPVVVKKLIKRINAIFDDLE